MRVIRRTHRFICCLAESTRRGIVMKQVLSFLRSSAVGVAFASVVILSIASAYAQTGTAAQGGVAPQAGSAQANSAVGQPPSGWSENAPGRGSWLSRIFGRSDAGPATSGQA